MTNDRTCTSDRGEMARPLAEDIVAKFANRQTVDEGYRPFGDGHACGKIVDILSRGV